MPCLPNRHALQVLATLAVATAAALLAQALRMPLPWMIGPLLAVAVLSASGAPMRSTPWLRNAGQWSIGAGLGLYFTPQALAAVASLWHLMLLGVAWALLGGYLFYRLIYWVQGGANSLPERAAAFFAGAIGGASEMAVMAERHGAPVAQVAAAHSLRVLLVVTVIPFTLQGLGVHGLDAYQPGPQAVQASGLMALVAATLAGVAAAAWLRLPNPWVLGALLVALGLTASGQHWSALPREVSQAGQMFIGMALGVRFTPQFVHTAPRLLAAVALGSLGLMALALPLAWALATWAGMHPATLYLGVSPGGIAEMCITAKVLGLGVPVVTAFHVVRYVSVLLLTRWIWALELCRLRLSPAP